MSMDPTFYNNIFPQRHNNFWLHLAPQEFGFVGGNMTTQQSFVTPARSSDAFVVYDGRNNANVANCVKIPARPRDAPGYDASGIPDLILRSDYHHLLGVSSQNPLDVYDTGLTNNVANTTTVGLIHEEDPTQTVMPKPLHRVPTTRQQHYHRRHHAHVKHPRANNLENKTRFSATGLSSNYMIVPDTKMSLSSAPSSPSAGSVGGSLGNGYLASHLHMTPSAAYCVPQYKGSSSSSCCSTTGLKISSSSMSSYSSRSSMSSTPSLSGISPRKRRADDVVNRDCYQRRCDGGITNLCSCEVCTTEEVTARVDDVTIRDVRTGYHGQQHKRSRNDSDVVFVSAEPGPSARRQQKATRKAKKSAKKAVYRQTAAAQQPATQLYSSFPFLVPSPCISPEPKDVGGRYFLRSAVKSRKRGKAASLMPKPATQSQQTHNSDVIQPMLKPFVCLDEMDDYSNSVMEEGNNLDVELAEKAAERQTPRYHTRSVQKKVNYDQQKPKVQADMPFIAELVSAPQQLANSHCDVSNLYPKPVDYLPTSVIQNAVSPSNCKQQYILTSTESSPASDGSNESPRSSSSLKKFYDIHGIIGVGGGGTVYAGTRKADGIQVAIKQVPKAKVKRWGKLDGRVVPIEFDLLHRASHSGHTGVIGMLDWYERRSTYILVMERPQPVIDLFDYLNQYGALSEATARAIFRQLAEAVLHCHANGVVHRDIKDENVLLNLHTSEAKLIDFGCGTVLRHTPYTEFAGTPEFYPPEWFTHRRYYGQRVDAWSLGVLLFTMVEAEVPFQKEKDIVECNLRHKRPADLSESCKNLIDWMLQKDQDMRPTIEQALKHPWFNESEAPLSITAAQPATSTEENGCDELYEKRLQHNDHVEKIQHFHDVVSAESPESPARPAVQENLLYHGQATCEATHSNVGAYQTVFVAR